MKRIVLKLYLCAYDAILKIAQKCTDTLHLIDYTKQSKWHYTIPYVEVPHEFEGRQFVVFAQLPLVSFDLCFQEKEEC